MSCWVVIPIKALDACKTRLRHALDDEERHALVRSMLENVVRAAQGARGVDRVLLLGANDHDLRIESLPDPGKDLNVALQALLDGAPASRLIILPADLPRVTSADIEALCMSERAAILIGPDRAATGTNALSLPLPAASGFRFQFGECSFTRHQTEAARLQLPVQIIRSDTLGLDIDTPADLEFLRASV